MKRLLALTLIFSLNFGKNTKISSAWYWKEEMQNQANACEEKNKCGQYIDVDCAISAVKEALPVADYKELNEVGKNCEYNIHMWTYTSLENFPGIIRRLLENSQRGYILNQAVRNITKEIGGLFKTDEISSAEVLYKWIENSEYCDLDKEQIRQLINEFIEKVKVDKSSSNTVGIIGALGGIGMSGYAAKLAMLTAGTTVSVAVIGAVVLGSLSHYAMSWWRSSNEEKEMEKHWAEVQNYASIIEQLLTHIKNGNWKFADSVLAQINFDPNFYKAIVTMVNSGIEYSAESKKGFNKKFLELQKILENMVKKNKK